MNLHNRFSLIALAGWTLLWMYASAWFGGRLADPPMSLFLWLVGFAVGVFLLPDDSQARWDRKRHIWMGLWGLSVFFGVLLGLIVGSVVGIVHMLLAQAWKGVLFLADVAFGFGIGLLMGLTRIAISERLFIVLLVAWLMLWLRVSDAILGHMSETSGSLLALWLGCVFGVASGSLADSAKQPLTGRSIKGSVFGGVFLGAILGVIRLLSGSGETGVLLGIDVVFGLGLGVLLGRATGGEPSRDRFPNPGEAGTP